MVDPSELRDLPPDRFGVVAAAVVANEWAGDADLSPPTPEGAVEAVIDDGERTRLVRFSAGARVDADAVEGVATLLADRGFDAATLVTATVVGEAAREAAHRLDVDLVDGDAFAAMVEAAGVSVEASDPAGVASLVRQLSGRWPEALREVAVELAATIDGAASFGHGLTRRSAMTDLDFLSPGTDRVAVRMRFSRESLLVYVRRGEALESVVRLTGHRRSQPNVADVEADLLAALSELLDD